MIYETNTPLILQIGTEFYGVVLEDFFLLLNSEDKLH